VRSTRRQCSVAESTARRIWRGTFTSVTELNGAIHDYLDRHNADPEPFAWTKTADIVPEKERRALDTLGPVKTRNRPLGSV
jgi:hypothetical protein